MNVVTEIEICWPKVRMGWQKREFAGLDSHDRIAVNGKLSVYLGVSHNSDFFQIAPILLVSSSSFQGVKISKNIFQKKKCHCQLPSESQMFPWWSLMLQIVKSHGCGRGGGEGVSQEIGAVDLAAICVATLRSVLEYNVAWLDITPFLPICLVQ